MVCFENKIAKALFKHHLNMIDVVGVAWQLNLISDDKCEALKKKHCMEAFKKLEFLGLWKPKERALSSLFFL